MAKFGFSRSLFLLTFFDNFKFWTPLIFKNVPNSSIWKNIKTFFKPGHFYAKLSQILCTQYWYSITKIMLVESRERLNYLVHAMHWIHIPMLTPYIVFLLKNATWFSSKVFPKYCVGNILFLTHNPFVCDLAYLDTKKYTEKAKLAGLSWLKELSISR